MTPMIAISQAASHSGAGPDLEAAAGAEEASPSSHPASSLVNHAPAVLLQPADTRAVEGSGNAKAASQRAAAAPAHQG